MTHPSKTSLNHLDICVSQAQEILPPKDTSHDVAVTRRKGDVGDFGYSKDGEICRFMGEVWQKAKSKKSSILDECAHTLETQLLHSTQQQKNLYQTAFAMKRQIQHIQLQS